MLIESRDSLDPELAALMAAQQREMRDSGHGRAAPAFVPGDADAHLVAIVGGRVVAGCAWRPLSDGAAELERMYVRPAFRNRGIARQMIVAIEEEALAAGRPVIRLATGSSPAAIALYRSSGYHEIPAYGEDAGNPYRRCFEKRLAALVQ